MQVLALAAAVGALAGAQSAPPAPESPIPTGPRALAARLDATETALAREVGTWVRAGDPGRGGPPDEVTLLALDQQRILRLLARRPDLAGRVLRRRPAGRRRAARTLVASLRAIQRLNAGHRPHRIRTAPPRPADRL